MRLCHLFALQVSPLSSFIPSIISSHYFSISMFFVRYPACSYHLHRRLHHSAKGLLDLESVFLLPLSDMSSELDEFSDLSFPDGSYVENNICSRRIFGPCESAHKIGKGQRVRHRFSCKLNSPSEETVQVRSVANPWPNHSAFGDLKPAADTQW